MPAPSSQSLFCRIGVGTNDAFIAIDLPLDQAV